jgi:hypothetical protein
MCQTNVTGPFVCPGSTTCAHVTDYTYLVYYSRLIKTVCRPPVTNEVRFQPQASGGQRDTGKDNFRYVSFLWQYHLINAHSSVTTLLNNKLKNERRYIMLILIQTAEWGEILWQNLGMPGLGSLLKKMSSYSNYIMSVQIRIFLRSWWLKTLASYIPTNALLYIISV